MKTFAFQASCGRDFHRWIPWLQRSTFFCYSEPAWCYFHFMPHILLEDFPCHSDFMDIYHFLHLQAKRSHSSFILQQDAASSLRFGMLFPRFSLFWNSTAFPWRHRTKTLYTVLWIKGHNMQQHYNALWFVYIFPDFSQYPIFLITPEY